MNGSYRKMAVCITCRTRLMKDEIEEKGHRAQGHQIDFYTFGGYSKPEALQKAAEGLNKSMEENLTLDKVEQYGSLDEKKELRREEFRWTETYGEEEAPEVVE